MPTTTNGKRRSMLSSQARVQVPWIKVTIGTFTFGVFSRSASQKKDSNDFYSSYNVQYPNYVKSMTVKKINGQVNQYKLSLVYPIKVGDDPNFFEKVFSSVSKTRKITFTYGDASQPAYVYKDEEAIITKVSQTFSLQSSQISYTVEAVSSAALGKNGSFTFLGRELIPSEEIKRVFNDRRYGLRDLFTGMGKSNIDDLIEGGDKRVMTTSQVNVSPLDYISYLVGCMVPEGASKDSVNKDIYILTIHDDTTYDKLTDGYDSSYASLHDVNGPYFRVERTSYKQSYSDAYEIDIGYNTSTIVTSFSIDNNENYSLYYDYSNKLYPEQYVERIGRDGTWEKEFAPSFTSNNAFRKQRAEDASWFTKLTKYPISATIVVQGLLRPAQLMQYVRLNVIFPGGGKHISSGLYIITEQLDTIDSNGYKTQLKMTRISGDDFDNLDNRTSLSLY